MFGRRIYYSLKPFVPWRVRMAVRRFFTRRKRKHCGDIWPIDESAGRAPEGWPGWPDGKKFAFVITHDVESPEGLQKCRQLAELEMELGFRSSFNFIPEGPYVVPPDLRAWLTEHGFEVGVHDLTHDGKLFRSRRDFKKKAGGINRYLKDWGAAGFRAGFMLRNLDWYHELDIEYDLSTFDTDPFEPQPDGVGTIFPFWIPAPAAAANERGPAPSANSRLKNENEKRGTDSSVFPLPSSFGEQGSVIPDAPSDLSRRIAENPSYPRPDARASSLFGLPSSVELPYTLPQDSTLFLVLQETTPEIWLRKLQWIVQHGGMALLNTHPDYAAFDGQHPTPREFPVEYYRDFLRRIVSEYSGHFWNPLPCTLAQWYHPTRRLESPAFLPPTGGTAAAAGLRGRRVAVLLYSYFPADPRPRRAAEAMVAAGMEVDVLCLAEDNTETFEDLGNGLRIFRFSCPRQRGGILRYLFQYSRFIAQTFWFLLRHSGRRRYDLVHVHNMPDVLVFSALWPRLRGAKVLLDLHDPMPELMMTIFGVKKTGRAIAFLRAMERCSIGFADHVITVNEACRQLFSNRSCRPSKVSVVMNSPDEEIFQYREPSPGTAAPRPPTKPFVIMYHGSLVERHGLDLAITALAEILDPIPGAQLRIFGSTTPYMTKVLDSITDPRLRAAVHFLGPKNLGELVKEIGECDVGVIPNRRSIFTEINTPTRIFEYLSQGKPTIAPRAPGILDYFGPDDLIYFELGDAADLAQKLQYVFSNPEAVARTVQRGQRIFREHSWSSERQRLLDTVAQILPPPAGAKTGGSR